MALRWAYTRPDGGVSIVQAMAKAELEPLIGKLNEDGVRVLTDEDYRDFVYKRSIPANAVNIIELPEDYQLPTREYRDAWNLVENKITVDTVKKNQIKITRIKAEAQRRIIALTGQPDLISSMIKQSNSNMRATELNDKRISGLTLSSEEEQEAAALRNLARSIKAIREASNTLEGALPEDYTDDRHWPSN